MIVQVAHVELAQDFPKNLCCQANVQDQVVVIELAPLKGGVHHVGCPVQGLGWAEGLTSKTVGDHHVLSDGQSVHGILGVSGFPGSAPGGTARCCCRGRGLSWSQAVPRSRFRHQ